MAIHRSPLLCVLLLAPACTTVEAEGSIYPSLLEAMHELNAEEARFAAATTLPKRLEFPGNGRVVIRELSLDGYPGNSYVRCRFHYENTTGEPVLRSFVSLDVLDSEGRMVASQVSVCIFPTPRAIYDGTFYADELRTPTRGVHEQPGWSWRITCRAQFYGEGEVIEVGAPR